MQKIIFLLASLLSTSLAMSQISRTFCVPNGLNGYYSFENTTNDRSGAGHHVQNGVGTQPNLVFSDQRVGNYSASFNGSSQYLQYSDGSFMNVGLGKMSVLFWIKTYQDTGVQTFFDEGGFGNGIAIRLQGNVLEAAIRKDEVQRTLTHQTSIDTMQWAHIALSYDNGTVALYLNGVRASDPDTLTGFGTIPEHPGFGGFGATIQNDAFGDSISGGIRHHFYGLMDDLAYYRGDVFGQSDIQSVIACQEIPLDCDNNVYIVQNSPSDVKTVNQTAAPYSFTTIKDDGEFTLNSMGYWEQDNMIYALVVDPLNSNSMVRISADGVLTDLGPIDNLDSHFSSLAGDVSPSGIFYFNDNSITSSIFQVDLHSLPYQATQTQFATAFNIVDLAYNPIDSLLYSINTGDFLVHRFDPSNGTMVSFATTPTFFGADGFGAIWFTLLGQMFAYKNNGEIYRIDLDLQTASFVSAGPTVNSNDGTTCTNVLPTVDIALAIDSVDFSQTPFGPGDSIYYSLHISNVGPDVATNIVIVDSIPDGLIIVDTILTNTAGMALDTSLYHLEMLGTGQNKRIQLSLNNLSPGTGNQVRLSMRAKVSGKGVREEKTCMYVANVDQPDTDLSNDTVCFILQEIASSIQEKDIASYLFIYPNPTTGHVTMQSPEATIQSVQLYDLTGRKIHASVTRARHEAILTSDHEGITLLKIHTDKGLVVRKIVFE